jgi:hypothetical protein
MPMAGRASCGDDVAHVPSENAMTVQQFQVMRSDLARTRWVDVPDTVLADGAVRVRVEHFAYTANNITYGAFGEAMHYWQFFPALTPPGEADAPAQGWGCIPVWGFGTVVQSLHPGVAVGERLYGYWPMASHALLQPARVTSAGFVDGAPHRASLHGVYNQLLRCSADPFYTPDSEAEQALLRPLFTTAWLIDDFLADQDFFGVAAAAADAMPGLVLLSSASSKTAYATAAHLRRRAGIEVVGLTSARHVAFCESLGVYRRVLAYVRLDALPADAACVYVDFAGNAGLRRAVHERFARLAHSSSIGGTHVDRLGGARDLPGPRPVLFFAPAQVKKRVADWGGEVFNHRLVAAWHAFRDEATRGTPPWLVARWHRGEQAVQAAHAQVLAGAVDPREGFMLSAWHATTASAGRRATPAA